MGSTILQCVNRMNVLHARVLAGDRASSLADARGRLTARATLRKWGAIDADGGVTDFGRDLLRIWRVRQVPRRP